MDTQQTTKSELEEDDGFLEWQEIFMKLPDEEKKKVLLDKAKGQMSEIDCQVIDDIIKLIEENPEEHTDLLWINNKLEEKYPDINPLAMMTYFFVLKTCGIIDLDTE